MRPGLICRGLTVDCLRTVEVPKVGGIDGALPKQGGLRDGRKPSTVGRAKELTSNRRRDKYPQNSQPPQFNL